MDREEYIKKVAVEIIKNGGCGKEISVRDGKSNHRSFCGCTYRGLHLCDACSKPKANNDQQEEVKQDKINVTPSVSLQASEYPETSPDADSQSKHKANLEGKDE